jgi:hypothetical protein
MFEVSAVHDIKNEFVKSLKNWAFLERASILYTSNDGFKWLFGFEVPAQKLYAYKLADLLPFFVTYC